jgi:GTP-binding protein
MDFIDEVHFTAEGGRGGNGCVSFRREKYVPKGGPDGGDGGNGGAVILYVDTGMSTLVDLRHRKRYKGKNGEGGRGKGMHGKRGKSVRIRVPPGTMVFNDQTGEGLGDLVKAGDELMVAEGGRGGRGNARFATSTLQAPDWAEQGGAGSVVSVRLVLKLLADVGLVGLPNAGKSTLLSRISAARPKIADYPFTTLVPNLGIVRYHDFRSCVVADIPGLIEGAHMGKGLGDRFLRHIERTRLLVFLIESSEPEPGHVMDLLLGELTAFNRDLAERPSLVALTKIDILNAPERKRLPKILLDVPCYPVSSVTGDGVASLLDAVFEKLSQSAHEKSISSVETDNGSRDRSQKDPPAD